MVTKKKKKRILHAQYFIKFHSDQKNTIINYLI